MSFKAFSYINALGSSALSASLILAPEMIIELFGMEQAPSASVLGRRAGILFLGYSVIFTRMLLFGSSGSTPKQQNHLLVGVGSYMAAMSAAGVYEYYQQRATSWFILAASGVEILMASWAAILYYDTTSDNDKSKTS